jgi:hypothetical protein
VEREVSLTDHDEPVPVEREVSLTDHDEPVPVEREVSLTDHDEPVPVVKHSSLLAANTTSMVRSPVSKCNTAPTFTSIPMGMPIA